MKKTSAFLYQWNFRENIGRLQFITIPLIQIDYETRYHVITSRKEVRNLIFVLGFGKHSRLDPPMLASSAQTKTLCPKYVKIIWRLIFLAFAETFIKVRDGS